MSKITKETTLAQLIELGIIKSTQIDTWNKRLERGAEKKADSLSQERCHFAVAFYIGATYKLPRGCIISYDCICDCFTTSR